MAVYNLGSINIDHVYQVPHLPAPGETLTALSYAMGLGGKGGNQSVAAARAGARALHIGAVGAEGAWARAALAGYGVDISHVTVGPVPTGHAIINVDPKAENSIVIYSGANQTLDEAAISAALAGASTGDTLLLQNETSGQVIAARLAAAHGMRVVYSAAPFDLAAVQAVLPYATLLVMNEGEAAQLRAGLGALPATDTIITKGAQGAEWLCAGFEPLFVPAFRGDAHRYHRRGRLLYRYSGGSVGCRPGPFLRDAARRGGGGDSGYPPRRRAGDADRSGGGRVFTLSTWRQTARRHPRAF